MYGRGGQAARTANTCAFPQRWPSRYRQATSLEQAALIEPACVSYHGAKRGELTRRDTVLVMGAGPIGNFTMQSCKALGARKVIIADLLDSRLDLALSLRRRWGDQHGTALRSKRALRRLLGDPKAVDVFYDCVGGKGRC